MRDLDNDFSDVVQGMDLELRHNDPKTFPVTHKIEALGRVSPPPLLKKMSEYQLVTIAGAASGFWPVWLYVPWTWSRLEYRLREKNRYGSFIQAFSTITREEGIRGLYRVLYP
ncbi:hypothetical protein CJJ09_004842 [Candidozyma auris]|nr:hypothetical protein CJJ09_004842 [[Candida] auris]